MSTRSSGSFEVKKWEEEPLSKVDDGPKVVHTNVKNVYVGDIEGEGTLKYVMIYLTSSSGSFIGLEQLVGRIGNRAGSFVLQHSGTFEGTVVNATWFVVPASGTGDLKGLKGKGGFVAKHGVKATPFTLDYEFE